MLSVAQQLDYGVRFLDIRLRNVDDVFQIYHGVFAQFLSFDDVLHAASDFLSANSGESILMNIQGSREVTGS